MSCGLAMSTVWELWAIQVMDRTGAMRRRRFCGAEASEACVPEGASATLPPDPPTSCHQGAVGTQKTLARSMALHPKWMLSPVNDLNSR